MPVRANPPNPNPDEAAGSPAPRAATLRLVVPAKQSKVRLDVYLTHQVQNATRNKVQQAIHDGLVLVNGSPVKPSHLISPGEVIDITLPKPPPSEAVAEDIPLDIIYEDDELLIVNKPAGMVTHPAYANYSGTLVNALLHHSRSLSEVNSAQRPGIVHRLDKDTSGLMVVAKTDHAHHILARQFSKRTIDREYWAVIWGVLKKKKGVIEASLGRSKKDRKKVTVTAEGKHAVTEYEVLESFGYLSLVRLKLKTGRTHQIRVHLAHIGHPVFGDPTYGGRSETWGGPTGKKSREAARFLEIIHRQALHAKTLGFIHPSTNKIVKFDSELPDDMKQLLEELAAGK
ncbi:MAG TPA: RluA family pseudouridine synthase [Bacteroidota bacterium]|nr:RluA family pseudouridine synthase [Bacteroidota bacterium]